MPLKLIAYDLAGTKGDCKALEDAVLNMRVCQKIQASVWMVHSSLDARSLRDRLNPLVDEEDNLVVCEVSDWSASGRAFKGASIGRVAAA